MPYALLLLAHLAGVIVWVGGMFFAHFCLRPAAVALLAPPQRLPLMAAALGRFLRYTAWAVLAVLASGFVMLGAVGMKGAPLGWHIMLGLGVVMAALFGHVYFALYPRLKRHAAASDWPAAAKALDGVRRLVALNLGLSVLTLLAAVAGR